MGPRTPTRYGRYEIVGPLAKGGMADLLLARMRGPEGFETLAVVKRILPHLAQSPEFVKLFLHEARLAAQLRHSNIVHVYDAGQEHGQYYFVMEYVHGRDLRALLEAAKRRGRQIRLDEAIAIAIGLCAGLHYAHERRGSDGKPLGIVHRDVSPSNVLIGFDGNVKLADFGIAKATSVMGADTATKTMCGKLGYMSPEQYLGTPLDRRSDLYALSVVVYELTTGERPHPTTTNELHAIQQTLETPIRAPSELRPDYPAELEEVVVAGLARDPALRPESAQHILVALESFARRRQLAVSSATVARLVEELFGDELRAWESAQQIGKTLSQHLTETGTVSIQREVPAVAAAPADEARAPRRRASLWAVRALAFVAAVGAATAIALAIGAQRDVDSASVAVPIAAPITATLPKVENDPPPAPAPVEAAPARPPTREIGPTASRAHTASRPSVRSHKGAPERNPRQSRSPSWDPEAPTLPH